MHLLIIGCLVVMAYCILSKPRMCAAYFTIIAIFGGILFLVCLSAGFAEKSWMGYILCCWAVLFFDAAKGVTGSETAFITQLKNEFE